MKTTITQQQAVDLFDLPEVHLYVCDGEKECGSASCADWSRTDCCHHTADKGHALYGTHDPASFERHPSVRDGQAVLICVEQIRGAR